MAKLTSKKDKTKFYGHYFKMYNNGKTFGIIPGISEEGGNIQVITDKKSWYFEFPEGDMGDVIKIGNSEFWDGGMKIDLPGIKGELKFTDLTPIAYDFMGVLSLLPLQDRHSVISIRHRVEGTIDVEGELYDFNGGWGYHECDAGEEFPDAHMWVQCNNFDDPKQTAVLLCVAKVPVLGLPLRGSIAIINQKGEREKRLSTYFLALTSLKKDKVTLWQLPCRKFVVEFEDFGDTRGLVSAQEGSMQEELKESNNAKANFKYYEFGKEKFNLHSDYVGYERRHL